MKSQRLEAAIGGSGSLALTQLAATELKLSMGGSGQFHADGRAHKVSVSLAGSGRCGADHLRAEDVTSSSPAVARCACTPTRA
ncbi:MAG: DUF2807 domain-containing protein [Caldimonas sp.]